MSASDYKTTDAITTFFTPRSFIDTGGDVTATFKDGSKESSLGYCRDKAESSLLERLDIDDQLSGLCTLASFLKYGSAIGVGATLLATAYYGPAGFEEVLQMCEGTGPKSVLESIATAAKVASIPVGSMMAGRGLAFRDHMAWKQNKLEGWRGDNEEEIVDLIGSQRTVSGKQLARRVLKHERIKAAVAKRMEGK